MKQINVRMEIDQETSAKVSYVSKSLGISKRKTYALIIEYFFLEPNLGRSVENLQWLVDRPDVPDPPKDDVPF